MLATVESFGVQNFGALQILHPVVSEEASDMPLWLAPSPNVVNLNVDAATSANAAFLAVVARDSSGSILNCWAKRSHSS